jgi:hypothetical protein
MARSARTALARAGSMVLVGTNGRLYLLAAIGASSPSERRLTNE